MNKLETSNIMDKFGSTLYSVHNHHSVSYYVLPLHVSY